MHTVTPIADLLDHPPPQVDATELAALPAAMAALPWHPRHRVPVPVMNVHTDDAHPTPFVDYLGVDPQVALRCGQERLCGICDTDLAEDIAFLGAFQSVQYGIFSDPPLHETCARAALRWCPHLRLRHHQRAPRHRRHPDTPYIEGWDNEPRPDQWGLCVAGGLRLVSYEDLVMFQPHLIERVVVFGYAGPDETLVEVATIELKGTA